VLPNLYPAFERHEVVVHSPEHKRSFADLAADEVTLVAKAWRSRRATHPDGYLHALVNEGRQAGASLAHTHSQLVWFSAPPPAVADESDHLSDLLRGVHERRWGDLEVEADQDVVAFCAPAGRVPYELLITSADDDEGDAFASDLSRPLLALRNVVQRLRSVEGHVPWNAWLHTGRGWHIEVVPRLTVFAGIELGAGIYVNTLPPEEAARRLRSAAIE
jgi:UDPglucose--hexose-1-phosphate uridylyltransferase